MSEKTPLFRKTHKLYHKMRLLLILLIPSLFLFANGCFSGPTDPRLENKDYFGTSWECTDPYAAFDVDDEGFCDGTLIYEDVTLPVRFAFREGLSRRSGGVSFLVKEDDGSYHIFYGDFKIKGNTMTITGVWSGFMESVYHQTYTPDECTLIFERKN